MSASRRVALVTYERAPDLAPDDRVLVPSLAATGIEARPVVWSDAAIDWRTFDAVVLRSSWDYHLRADEFRAWLGALDSAGVQVLNSPALVRWNSDKRYLLDLARRGVATIPTMVVPRGATDEVSLTATAEGWSRIVVKPTVSASGYETHALDLPFDDDARAIIARVTRLTDVLVQPFAPEVPRNGEYSFTFIEGEFSHATIKRARAGEFRVQTEHGGSVEPAVVSASLVAQASHALAVLPEVPLYARVDGITRGDAFLLMELELIEPNLFLELGNGAADRLARAILRALDKKNQPQNTRKEN
ncbi:MAG: ATP-grasp domain-containing protein [bacterium]